VIEKRGDEDERPQILKSSNQSSAFRSIFQCISKNLAEIKNGCLHAYKSSKRIIAEKFYGY